MIHGVGIDLVEIERIRKWYNNKPEMFRKILTSEEQALFSEISLESRKVEFIAGRFTVKEAFSKAMGTGIGKEHNFHSIACLPDKHGKPTIQCEGYNVQVSITHTKELAEAIVIVEKL